jgi:hypothetical protein
MNKDNDLNIVKKHVSQLSEHFDTVQIFVTKRNLDTTIDINHGSGNWFARYGQVNHWLIREEANVDSDEGEGEDEEEEDIVC